MVENETVLVCECCGKTFRLGDGSGCDSDYQDRLMFEKYGDPEDGGWPHQQE